MHRLRFNRKYKILTASVIPIGMLCFAAMVPGAAASDSISSGKTVMVADVRAEKAAVATAASPSAPRTPLVVGQASAVLPLPTTATQVSDDAGSSLATRLAPVPRDDRPVDTVAIVTTAADAGEVPLPTLEAPPTARVLAPSDDHPPPAMPPPVVVAPSSVEPVSNKTKPSVEREAELGGTGQIASPAQQYPATHAQIGPRMAPQVIAGLLRRGDDLLGAGDVLSARLLYERAAAGGSGAGATGVAKTYDTSVLTAVGARGIRGDSALAADWYRKAIALGDGKADALLRTLERSAKP